MSSVCTTFVLKKLKKKMLEVKNASVSLGGKLLFEGVSFTVGDGEILCITGDSGCGKTTILRAMLGFLPLSAGHVSIGGELLTPASAEEFRKQMAYLPQELALPADSVAEMVQLPFALCANRGRTFSKQLLMDEWAQLDLAPELYYNKVAQLSGGQRQRVMLSVCGLLNKSVLLVDEPTSALDSHSAALVLNYLRQLAGRGTSVIAVSHDMAFAQGCDKRVVIASAGGENNKIEE